MQGQNALKSLATKDIFLVADELSEALKDRSDKPRLPVGIKDLDEIIWGVHRKELLIVASRPSQGKTSLTVNMAWNLAKLGKKVVYVSLEMSAHSVLERILCNEFSIDGWRLRKGFTEQLIEARQSMDKMRSRLLTYPLTIIDDHGFKANELDELVTMNGAEILFIDHLQRISMAGYKSRQECLADYVQETKRVAMRNNCAVILASQINRAGDGQDNAMSNLKGTGEQEEAADTLLQLRWIGRENFFKDPKNPMVDRKEYQINILKQRHGPVEGITVDFDVEYYRFNSRGQA
jgi:replicative DNA helicase